MKSSSLKHTTIFVLIISLISSCAGIPGKKIKLEDYPKATKDQRSGVDLGFAYSKKENDPYDYSNFNFSVQQSFNKLDPDYSLEKNYGKIFEPDVNAKNKCSVRVYTKNGDMMRGLCMPYFLLSELTLFTIPFYCQISYQATATLISHPSELSLKDKAINILPDQININQTQIKQSKTKNKGIVTKTNYLITQNKQRINEGDYFLDENGRLTKLLKTYELKDKVHEVWSSLMLIAAVPFTSLRKLPSARAAKLIVEQNISEALVRSIINDASSFKECQKDQSSSSKNK